MKITHTYPKTTQDELHEKYGAPRIDEVDEKVMARHHKVAEIINRHLEEIEAEILRLDQSTMNIVAPAIRRRSPARCLPC